MLEPKKFACHNCIFQYGKSERLQKKTLIKRNGKGCFVTGIKTYQIENIKYTKCVGNFTTKIDYYLEAFSKYEKGMLPYTGMLGDQPNKILEIFSIISQRIAEKRKET